MHLKYKETNTIKEKKSVRQLNRDYGSKDLRDMLLLVNWRTQLCTGIRK